MKKAPEVDRNLKHPLPMDDDEKQSIMEGTSEAVRIVSGIVNPSRFCRAIFSFTRTGSLAYNQGKMR